jgi:hypothetical protein
MTDWPGFSQIERMRYDVYDIPVHKRKSVYLPGPRSQENLSNQMVKVVYVLGAIPGIG